MSTVLLLDADILCYQTTASVETEVDWGDDFWTLHSDLQEAIDRLGADVAYLTDKLSADEVILCFTDGENFRKQIYPQYKTNRKGVRKPLAYKALVAHCKENYETFTRPNLEADDVMGILATWPKFRPGAKKVIVSEDKDLKTIGGAWLFNPAKHDEPVFNDPHEAYLYFLEQTLTGDTTDGYPGCPGIGPVKAKAALEKADEGAEWAAVVALYLKAGLSEEVALQQARCARILHATDYDFKRKEPKLWLPPQTISASTT